MITVAALQEGFYPVEDLGGGLVRCDDELPKTVFHNYFLLDAGSGHYPFLVSQDLIDDDFARAVLEEAARAGPGGLAKLALAANPYGFTHWLRVPSDFHSELKGRLDADRPATSLCIPIHEPEFSGDETSEAFVQMRRGAVATARWDRPVTPKISFRFDNPRTGGGTGDRYVLASFELLLREVENLLGVTSGFAEIVNYRGEVVELVPTGAAQFNWISERDDSNAASILPAEIPDRLRSFVGG